ncbi:MAG: putative glycosyltransferase [Phycisphaerales bacterium]|nr:putative glycosyltransferase [Phycisphaerales bacterium]
MALKRNVLIFHSGALGDFVLSWPLALAFGRLFAQSRVFYVTAAQKGRLADKVLRIESVDAETGWHGLHADPAAGPPALPDVPARLLAGAHTVAGFVAGPGSTWERNVRAAAPGAELLAMAAHPPPGFAGHHTEFLLQQLAPMVVWQRGVEQMLASVRQRGLGVEPTPGGPIVIHPGAGSPDKCWPADRFVELTKRLAAAGRAVRFVVGEVELERWSPARLDALAAVAELRRPNALVGLLEALAGASAFVGNDSGPGHLAAMLGLPTISLFGPTDPAVWRPVGPRVTVIRGEAMDGVGVDEVIAATAAAAP